MRMAPNILFGKYLATVIFRVLDAIFLYLIFTAVRKVNIFPTNKS